MDPDPARKTHTLGPIAATPAGRLSIHAACCKQRPHMPRRACRLPRPCKHRSPIWDVLAERRIARSSAQNIHSGYAKRQPPAREVAARYQLPGLASNRTFPWRSGAHANDRLALASLSRVERRDGVGEGHNGSDVRAEAPVSHPADDLHQLTRNGLDDEFD